MRIAGATFPAVLLASIAQPALAADRHAYEIPAGRLSDALVRLGQQAGITIGTDDPALAGVKAEAVRGSYTLLQALRRLLAGTGFDFKQIDAQTVRVFRSDQRPAARIGATALPVPPPPALAWPDIIVTASKRDTALEDFPASISVVTLDQPGGPSRSALGTSLLVSRLPMLFSTDLGPGRNKLFIRGVADSSFTGPTQATVGQYLGDVRLNYNAPDPDLNLYDIARVEVLEGPQGTLYGAGSLGGILRLVPNEPKLHEIEATMAAGATATEHGATGYDIAAMGNFPILAEAIALRLVAYRSIDGGYIDDAGRDARNVNRTRVEGGRATLRISPGDDWIIDLGGTIQNLNSSDSQYAERDLPPRTRSSAIAQPFDNDYSLWQAVVRKSWATLDLVSATGLVRHDVGVRYDATGFPGTSGPSAFDETSKITLITHETRLARSNAGGSGWLAGLSFVSDIDRIRRQIGDPAAPAMIAGIRNEVVEAAIFGEGTLPVAPRVMATVGGRITYAHLTGESLDNAGDPDTEPQHDGVRLLPTVALAWKPRPNLLTFIRYQQGFRAGGLSVDPSGAPNSAQRFRADRIASTEAGMRLGKPGQDRLTAAFTLSYTRWKNIQADLVGTSGLPFTATIGDGRIYGLEASASWMPIAGMVTEFATFINDSTLSDPAPAFGPNSEELPNIPRAGARAAISYRTNINSRLLLSLDTAVRYVGTSSLGVGSLSDLGQGNYVDVSAGIGLDAGNWGVTLAIVNATNIVGNRFALGNPIDVAAGDQTTPLRPRNVRLGVHAAF